MCVTCRRNTFNIYDDQDRQFKSMRNCQRCSLRVLSFSPSLNIVCHEEKHIIQLMDAYIAIAIDYHDTHRAACLLFTMITPDNLDARPINQQAFQIIVIPIASRLQCEHVLELHVIDTIIMPTNHMVYCDLRYIRSLSRRNLPNSLV